MRESLKFVLYETIIDIGGSICYLEDWKEKNTLTLNHRKLVIEELRGWGCESRTIGSEIRGEDVKVIQ